MTKATFTISHYHSRTCPHSKFWDDGRQWILPYYRHVSEQSATERFVLRRQKPGTVFRHQRYSRHLNINLKLTFFHCHFPARNISPLFPILLYSDCNAFEFVRFNILTIMTTTMMMMMRVPSPLKTGGSPDRKTWGGHTWRTRNASPNGGLGAEPKRCPGTEPMVTWSGAKSPWSWKHFRFWMPNGNIKFTTFSVFCKLASRAPNVIDPLPSPPP